MRFDASHTTTITLAACSCGIRESRFGRALTRPRSFLLACRFKRFQPQAKLAEFDSAMLPRLVSA